MAAQDPTLRSESRGGVQSLDRAVAILNCFDELRPELGASEIAREVGLTRSTAHRLLQSLQTHDLVQQVPGSRNYALGPHILRLAHAAVLRVNLPALAKPVMVRLRDEVDETVGLHVYQGDQARVVIDQVESHKPLRRSYTEIGEPIPLFHGAPGKLLLAHLDERQRKAILSGEMPPATPHTHTDPVRLNAELTEIVEQGHALSFQERLEGISSLAVPVWNHTGAVVAALSVSGPSSRLPEQSLREMAEAAKTAAAMLTASMAGAIGVAQAATTPGAPAPEEPEPRD